MLLLERFTFCWFVLKSRLWSSPSLDVKRLVPVSFMHNLCKKYWKLMLFIIVPNVYNESETITKFEIMDGAPVRGL